MGDYVDFKEVKAAARIDAVARNYGVGLRRTNGSHERGKCPLPTHPVGDDAKSFSINTAKQVWICHSTACAQGRRGKKGGDVIELVAAMENCSLRDAGLKLASWFGVQPKAERTEAGEIVTETSQPVTGIDRPHFGIYKPLGEWIESRLASGSLSRFEEAAYLSVLGKIEELAEVGRNEP